MKKEREQELLKQVSAELDRSAAYQAQYLETLKPAQNMLEVQGILAGMMADILEFEIKKGRTKNSEQKKATVLRLMELYESFSSFYETMRSVRLTNIELMNRNVEVESERDELIEKLKKYEQWEAA